VIHAVNTTGMGRKGRRGYAEDGSATNATETNQKDTADFGNSFK
jgi:hypothetical protein